MNDELANAAEPPNDNENYAGDRLSFPVNIDVTYNDNVPLCIPAGTTLRGLRKLEQGALLVTYSGKEKDCGQDPKKIPKNVVFSLCPKTLQPFQLLTIS